MGTKKGSRRAAPPVNTPQHPAVPQFDGDLEVTSAADWVQAADVEAVPLPSGNVARVKRVGPEAFLAQGVMPDALAPIVQRAINEKRGLPPKKIEQMMMDPKMVGQMLEMIDRVTCYAVVEPRVFMPPVCEECGEHNTVSTRSVHLTPEETGAEGKHQFKPGPRVPGVLYVDRVDLEDKTFIMNFCVGGTRDLERFRKKSRASLGRMDAQPSVEGASV